MLFEIDFAGSSDPVDRRPLWHQGARMLGGPRAWAWSRSWTGGWWYLCPARAMAAFVDHLERMRLLQLSGQVPAGSMTPEQGACPSSPTEVEPVKTWLGPSNKAHSHCGHTSNTSTGNNHDQNPEAGVGPEESHISKAPLHRRERQTPSLAKSP